ncbi:MAG TPA: metallophosphoesterase [Caldithrix sp.]|nr:metallophosphoesterase family protein [Calditrichaceae bacterium]HEM49017.1 metallophosphoesterase [Caldithrix sp.]
MKVGVIADTHNQIPGKVFAIFSGVNLIIHAGDVGQNNILTDLQTIAPVKAVFGNMDQYPLVSDLKRFEIFQLDEYKICLTHIIGSHKTFAYELFKQNIKVDVVIHGHTHRAEDVVYNKIRFLNPGSASQPRSGSRGSVGILVIGKEEMNFELYYL